MTSRYQSIDGLRGVAVMGILLMNVAAFALPSGAYFNPYATGTPSVADLAAWAAAFVLVDGKMRALFSILFGASTLLIANRAEQAGGSAARVHLSRMGVLALFGAAHGVLVWSGDILLHYALVGTLALPCTRLEPHQQIKVAMLLLLAQATIQGLLIADDIALRAAAAVPGASADTVAQWHAFAAAVGAGRLADVATEIAIYRGGYAGIVAANAHAMLVGTPFLLVFDGPETLAYMLIGMTALSSGFLTGDWTHRRYAVVAATALAIGLPLSALLCLLAARSGFDTIATFAAATIGGVPLRPVIALGYAALLLPWLSGEGTMRGRIRATGRLAFSNYLGTSVAMTALCYGWGLGLYGRLPRAGAYLLVLPVWLAMLAWSAPWLRRFRYGPLEWLWRSLARGRPQPFMRSQHI